jgi:hypothetical protein
MSDAEADRIQNRIDDCHRDLRTDIEKQNPGRLKKRVIRLIHDSPPSITLFHLGCSDGLKRYRIRDASTPAVS